MTPIDVRRSWQEKLERVEKRQKYVVGPLVTAAVLLGAGSSRADDTIKHPGDHPDYHVEVEPHLVLAFDNLFGSDGFGIGGRFSIPIVQNGFIKNINNSVALGFGLDFVHYSGYCHYRGLICDATYFFIPVVMQWNFFVAERWSVFGEPGLAIYHGFGFDSCPPGTGDCYDPHTTGLLPVVFFAGGRYHFSEAVSLTMRIGWPMFTIGVSFFP